MSEGNREVVRISAECAEICKKFAAKHTKGDVKMTPGEAADKLIATGSSRLKALARYSTNQKADAKPKKPRAKKKAKSKSNGAAAHA